MTKSILNNKRILAIDDEPDVLEVLEEEIKEVSPDTHFEKATSYHSAVEMLKSQSYDLVILDIMGVRGFDLLNLAISRNMPVTMLTAHALHPEALKRSIEMGARAYLPKEKMGEIVPFLENTLKYDFSPGWKSLLENLQTFFNAKWGEYWQKSEAKFWEDFNKRYLN